MGKLESSQQELWSQFTNRLELAITDYVDTSGAAFIRLSSRSPKDAVDKVPSIIVPLIKAELEFIANDLGCTIHDLDFDSQLFALRRAFFEAMKVTSIDRALDLIAFSSRTISDLKRALDYRDLVPWNLKVVIREFVPMPIDGEYRGFVYNNQLNAVSQYYADSYFPSIKQEEKSIVDNIKKFFLVVRDKIKLDNYIIDFAVNGDDVFIVELNPYSSTTGSCLFDWGEDQAIFENGPFEFRYVDEPTGSAEAHLLPWKNLMRQALS
eukprot:TRINITY_DN460_c0_g1_i2.p1 TRINITY_DN460_c0_g1~~TRINITY_DN460_c0_g1_i2.p1  ORF type:complete len:266 (+),score=54.56 TRINITY_DN460_c0_g1_i2:190-987(+)